MNQPEKNIRVGIGVMIFRDGKVLIGKRKSKLGEGDWSFPGGHLEVGELFVDCALRETKEETGIEITNIQFQMVGNIPDTYSQHYVQLAFTADWKSGEPRVLEPEKCERWEWRSLDDLPAPLFVPTQMMVSAKKSSKNFLDSKRE